MFVLVHMLSQCPLQHRFCQTCLHKVEKKAKCAMGHPDHIRFGNCLQDPAMNPPTPLPSPINMLPHRPFATPVPTALIHTLEKNTKLAVGHPDQIRSGNRQPLPAIPPPWHTMLSHYLGGSFVFIVYFLLV